MDVPLLLTAVSATSPCGEDMEYDAQFLQLERDAKGQPERSMGDSILPAEPPEWRSIQQQSLDLLGRSKDLRITHFLLQSALALQGVAGLAEVLTLINDTLAHLRAREPARRAQRQWPVELPRRATRRPAAQRRVPRQRPRAPASHP